MKKFLVTILVVLISISSFADGTITTPVNNAPTTWKVARVITSNGVAGEPNGIQIVIYQLTAGGLVAQQNVVDVVTNADLNSFLAQQETAAPGEPAGTTLAIRAKRLRMRWTKWLVDNGKVSNFSSEV